MPQARTHPTPQDLIAFVQGRLSPAAATAVESHLAGCPTCREAVPGRTAGATPVRGPETWPAGSTRIAAPAPTASLPAPPVSPLLPAPLPPPVEGLPPELEGHAKYRVVRELGRGGMGVVYQAVQTLMDRPVALKVINPGVLAHPDALPRFHAEVRAAARLDHPHIVRAHDAEQVGNLHLLVMEFVEGQTLADLVQKRGPLSVAQACHLIRQAALGLQHAFEQGMVHRDVKPHNLMVSPRGQVKILDFGLARMGSERPLGSGLTAAGAFMGTPEYVAPEQATDARTADTRADIYSLGCTLFFALTGQPPFQEDTPVKLVLAHLEREPRPLHAMRPDVPAELSAVVARMLAKDPNRRPQTPQEVAQALAPFVKAEPKAGARSAVTAAPNTIVKVAPEIVAPPPALPVATVEPEPFRLPLETSDAGMKGLQKWPTWMMVSLGAGAGVLVLAVVVALAVVFTREPQGPPKQPEVARAGPPAPDKDPTPTPPQAPVVEPPPVQPREDPAPPATPAGPEGKRPGPAPAPTSPRPGPTRKPAAPEPDPIRDRLELAKADNRTAVEALHRGVLEDLEKRQEAAAAKGRTQDVDRIRAEREKFEGDGKFLNPQEEFNYNQSLKPLRANLQKAYEEAVAAYTKARQAAKAGAADKELKRFLQADPGDAFQAGTTWKGRGWWSHSSRTTYDAALTVLTRDGSSFTARFESHNKAQIREIRGTIDRGVIRWLSRDVKVLKGGPGPDFTGRVSEFKEIYLTFMATVDKKIQKGELKLRLVAPPAP